MPQVNYFTAEDVRALPDDGKRYETVHGELLVTPAPGGMHQVIVSRLMEVLLPYLRANGLEQLLSSPADISWSDDTLVQPDLFAADIEEFKRTGKWTDVRTLFLVIEIVSPSSARTDRFAKRRLYQERRIPEYWVVDIDQRQVEVWTPDALFPVVERDRLVWRHPSLSADCVVDVARLLVRG